MTLASLAHLSHGRQSAHPGATWAEYRTLIETAIDNQPRSLQVRVGPSELGNPCDRCLISKLAGIPEARGGVAWLPFVGTAVHGELETIFAQANRDLPAGMVRYLVEQTISVGEVGGVDITGHADLFDLWAGEVTDWKCVGATTLRDAKANGPSETYRRQAHLYGYGFTRRGVVVNRVRIAYLPRNDPTLANAHIWTEPYDEQVARSTLDRANAFAAGIAAIGIDTVLDQAPPHSGGHSCGRYQDGPPSKRDGHPTTTSLLNIA